MLAFPTMIHQFKSRITRLMIWLNIFNHNITQTNNITQTEPNLQENAMFNPLCVMY